MLSIHHQHLRQHQELAKAQGFNVSIFRQSLYSVYTHIASNPRYCLLTGLCAYGLSIGMQATNDALGYAIFVQTNPNNAFGFGQTMQAAALGMAIVYPFFAGIHHAAAAGFEALHRSEHELLGHLLAILHDLISSLLYTKIGASLSKVAVSDMVSIAAIFLTIIITGGIFLAEKIAKRDIIIPNEIYKLSQYLRHKNNNTTPISSNAATNANNPAPSVPTVTNSAATPNNIPNNTTPSSQDKPQLLTFYDRVRSKLAEKTKIQENKATTSRSIFNLDIV